MKLELHVRYTFFVTLAIFEIIKQNTCCGGCYGAVNHDFQNAITAIMAGEQREEFY
jgi:hypothetical protein